jgi:hypothetical protein
MFSLNNKLVPIENLLSKRMGDVNAKRRNMLLPLKMM